MKQFTYEIKEPLTKGLAERYNVRNQPFLIESVGAVPYEGVLQAVQQFTALDTASILGVQTWPYPQLFVLSDAIVVCTATAIYELISGVLTLQLGGLTEGTRWNCLDFKTYIYLTNGQVAVTKKQEVYAIDTSVPFGVTVCEYLKGQVIIGAPNVPCTGI